ncbi:MgtC/SapB family protein [Rhodohalobacter sp. 8-1]|uniref:MgtC/SapB family protein n=1 Tax=Rhodohalobacter sp. 8-1 TaxID=3131972 RepID=UPI0030ED517F
MPNILSGYEPVFLIDVVLSLIAGFCIGAERESRGKDAGISTHSLVITGAMLYTFLSMRVDPSSQSRIAAQVVTGIGFLGAGLILKEGATVKNLTTAASLWFAGAIGMSFGFGYHVIGIVASIISGFIPRVAHLSRRPQKNEKDKD